MFYLLVTMVASICMRQYEKLRTVCCVIISVCRCTTRRLSTSRFQSSYYHCRRERTERMPWL